MINLDLYRRYLEARPKADDLGKIMPYGWVKLPDSLFGDWMVYSTMLDDFARELANAINQFTLNVRRLKTWDALLLGFDEKETQEAMHEFIDPAATLSLLTPYMIRSRFLYATSHLCHQINLIREEGWQESSLPEDGKVYMDSADRQGKPWKQYRKLKLRIESIGGKALQSATKDFRNAFTHRFSPRIESGITNFMTRQLDKSTGKAVYALGGTKPLPLGDVVALLITELARCYAAHEAFQQLVAEHEAFIGPNSEAALVAIRSVDRA
jgi:hypothetical protein